MRAALLAICLLPAGSVPDLLTPGHKPVRHELVLAWGEDIQGVRFVASPTAGFHGHHEIARGVPFRFSSKYGTRLHAAPTSAVLPAQSERVREGSWPSADIPVAEVNSVPSGHPLARVETTLRVVRVDSQVLIVERAGERRFDANGLELGGIEWLPLVLIAAGGAVWIWRIDRRRRRSQQAPGPAIPTR